MQANAMSDKIRTAKWKIYVRGQSIKKQIFLNLLLYLQLNQTCLLQSRPLLSWQTAPNVFAGLERDLERVLRDGAKVPYPVFFCLLCLLKLATF